MSLQEARIPAWKRLGLKLKYAKDTAHDENIAPHRDPGPAAVKPSAQPLKTAAKRPFQNEEPVKSAKRPKPDPQPSTPSQRKEKRSAFDDYQRSRAQAPQRHIGSIGPSGTLQAAGVAPKRVIFGDDDEDIISAAQSAEGFTHTARPPSPRKTVSFTPDTKAQDGFSAQTFFNTPTSVSLPEPAGIQKERKKKPKRSKSTLISQDASNYSSSDKARRSPGVVEDSASGCEDREALPYVQYLEHYHTSRATWKFNKKQQQNILKNLLNLHRIPPKFNPALCEYISGLQGSSRRHFADQALGVSKSIFEGQKDELANMSLDGPADRKVAYYKALEKQIEKFARSGAGRSEYLDHELEEIRLEAEQAKRAQAVLQCLENELDELLDVENAALQASAGAATASADGSSEMLPAEPMPSSQHDIRLPNQVNDARVKKRNKRKARTAVSDVDTSEDESDSDEG